MRLPLLAALAFTALWAAPARAAFEDLGAGARAPGLGGAFTALADDAYAVFYNPAGLAQMERSQFSASYSKLYAGLSDGSDLSLQQFVYAHPLRGGRWGTLGGGWSRLGLSDIYAEQSLYLSYGRELLARESGSRLLAGINAKYLSHSFKALPEATGACDLNQCGMGIDPVLTGQNSKSAIDADIGLVYRFPQRFQAGLMAEHVMRPDVGFAGPDRLPRNYRAGLTYKSLWMSLTGEVRLREAPDGSKDKDLIFAGERVFPTMDFGQFVARGSLGMGSRDYKQLTAGASYRINKIQVDYAFLMPLGGVKSAGATHRMAIGFHFGAPTAEDDISREMLEKARLVRDSREGREGYGYEFEQTLRPHDLSDPKLSVVRGDVAAGRYRLGFEQLKAMTRGQEVPPSLTRLTNRLELVAFYYPDYPTPRDQWEVALSSAFGHFLAGRDRLAMLTASYALSHDPANVKLGNFVGKLEEGTRMTADRLPAQHPRTYIEELLFRVDVANGKKNYGKVQEILNDVLELQPENLVALERLGSAYFIVGRYAEAIEAWERALPLEKKPAELQSLNEYIRLARERSGKAPLSLPAMKAPAPAAPAPILPDLPPERPAPVPARAPAAAPAGDPRDVAALYQKGVEHYARGAYLQATAMFNRILQIDPNNVKAKKALERIQQRAPR